MRLLYFFKSFFSIKKWSIKNYTIISLFVSLTIICIFLEENLFPKMPYGGSCSIKYIPLMIVSYMMGFAGGWLTGIISSLFSLLFIGNYYIINPLSYLLDYFFPMTTPAIVAWFRFNLKDNRIIYLYINYFLHCFLVCFIIFFWQTMSGYFIWTQVINNQKNINNLLKFSPFFYSLFYNFIHIFIFTYPIIQLIIPFIYRNLVSRYI